MNIIKTCPCCQKPLSKTEKLYDLLIDNQVWEFCTLCYKDFQKGGTIK